MDQTVNGAGKRTQNLVRDVGLTEGLCWYSRELCACVCESRECQEFTVNSELQSLTDKGEEGDLDVCVHVLCHYAGVIEGSVLSVAACVAGHVSVLCVPLCVSVCVRLWDICSTLLPVEHANRKAVPTSVSLEWRP